MLPLRTSAPHRTAPPDHTPRLRAASLALAAVLLAAVLLAGCASGPRAPESRVQPGDAPAAPAAQLPQAGISAPPPGRGPADEVVLRALTLLGVPYRHGGDSPEVGFDCSGLVGFVFRNAAGVELPRTAEALGRIGEPVDRSLLRPGDLIFFNTARRPFSHVGIYMGQSRFIHAPSTGGVVRVENLHGNYWRSRFDGARRLTL